MRNQPVARCGRWHGGVGHVCRIASLDAGLRAQAGVALTGRVISEEEGPMEGVVVTARKEGSTISMSVVTDNTGPLQLPGSETPGPATTSLKIRAIGYELLGPTAIDVTGRSRRRTRTSNCGRR